jgi:hypothetical protein
VHWFLYLNFVLLGAGFLMSWNTVCQYHSLTLSLSLLMMQDWHNKFVIDDQRNRLFSSSVPKSQCWVWYCSIVYDSKCFWCSSLSLSLSHFSFLIPFFSKVCFSTNLWFQAVLLRQYLPINSVLNFELLVDFYYLLFF